MLKSLRLQLSILYPLVGLALVVLLGGGAYALIRYYQLIEYYPDLELQARMSEEFDDLGIAVPDDLAQQSQRAAQVLDENHSFVTVSVLFLDAHGQILLSDGEVKTTAFIRGLEGARVRGRDLRTGQLPDGRQVRYLTYRLPLESAPVAYVQIGRQLTTQDLLINRLFILLIGLGVTVAAVIALFSWWLAGRSVLPAQSAWEHQQKFIANASHELRTPITLIRANAEVALRPGTRDPRRLELLHDIVQECDHVSRLVEDLLLLSRLDAGKLALERVPVAAGELCEEVGEQFRSLAEARGVTLTLESGAGSILGDRTRLRQVLTILVDNALKYTPSGGTIRLSAARADDHVVLQVEDNGVGIALEHLPHVFERFYQVEAGSAAGSGLGLPIAKALVQVQGGAIRIRSQPPHGTCVTVQFPVASV